MTNKAVFLDKDGTLIHNVPYNVDPDQIVLSDRAGWALNRLGQAGFLLVVVSNQSGVARGFFPYAALDPVKYRLNHLVIDQAAVELAGIYFCPHHPQGVIPQYTVECECRKPAPGMIFQAAAELDIDLAQSWMIGDILDDVEAGRRAGCRTILINNGNETEWQISANREPHFIVSTLEEAAKTILSILVANETGASQLPME